MKALTQDLKLQATVHEIKHLHIGNHPCVYIYFSIQPQGTRIFSYVWEFEDHNVRIDLTTKESTFEQRRKEFASVLKTLKIRERL